MRKKFPCLGCEERTLGCHGGCEKYAEAQKSVREEKDARWREYEADSYRRWIVVRNKVIRIKEAAKH